MEFINYPFNNLSCRRKGAVRKNWSTLLSRWHRYYIQISYILIYRYSVSYIWISCILYSDILYRSLYIDVLYTHIQIACILYPDILCRFSYPDILYTHIQITWILITRYPIYYYPDILYILLYKKTVYTFISKYPVLFIFYIQLLSALGGVGPIPRVASGSIAWKSTA